MRTACVFTGLLFTMGCAAAPAPAAQAPEPPEMLDALIIDDAPTVVAEFAGCPEDGNAQSLPSYDDSSLPEVNRSRSRASNMNRGQERLDDVQLHESMRPLQAKIFECLDVSTCATGQEIQEVEFDFDFEVGNDGRVRAATVRPSVPVTDGPLLPCARVALADIEFPSYNGGNMFVSYQLSVE